MAQDTTPALVLYVGKPDQTYGFDFDKGSFGDVKVAFVRRGLTDYTYDPDTFEVHGFLYAWNGGVYTKTETPDTDTPLYDKDGVATGDTWEATMYREPKNDIFTRGYIEWTGEPLTSNDVICIVRETQKDQPYSYPNNQKHIERALDNLSRQIQELQLTADNALKVDPSWNYTMDDERKMDPIAWLQTIVRSKGLTLREVRIDNGYIEYTTDDPDSTTKTWNVVAGVKTGNGGVVSHIRETRVLAEDGITWIPYLEYSVDGGNSWKPAGREQAELEAQYVKKSGDTMTGTLISNKSIETSDVMRAGKFLRFTSDSTLGSPTLPWPTAYIQKINNGSDLTVPNPGQADTLGLKSEIDLAANSGSQLRDKGVWYAKMDSATTPPASAGVEGRNYADFTQVDGNGDPIIVIYTYTSGAWTQTETIVPPASYNGYLPITSKFWDIQEQTGQQGGLVLWSYSAKTFTPYPRIISTDGIAITNSTFSNGTLTNVITEMPGSPVDKTVANKKYVDDSVAAMQAYMPDLFDFKWKDCTISRTGWKQSNGNQIPKASAEEAYQHLLDDYNNITQIDTYWAFLNAEYFYRMPSLDADVAKPYPYAYTYIDPVSHQVSIVYSSTQTGELVTYYSDPDGTTVYDTATNRYVGHEAQMYIDIYPGNIGVYYYTANDGHKIVTGSDQHGNMEAVYAAVGVAWYYFLNTASGSEYFILPRTQHAFVGSRGNVGNYVAPGLPNITGAWNDRIAFYSAHTASGAVVAGTTGDGTEANVSGTSRPASYSFDASKSNSIYGASTTVQAPATQMYLYFYIGV